MVKQFSMGYSRGTPRGPPWGTQGVLKGYYMGYSGQDGHGVMFWTDFRTTHASLRSGRCAKYSHRVLQVLTQGTPSTLTRFSTY